MNFEKQKIKSSVILKNEYKNLPVMENQNNKPQNGASQPAIGSNVPKGDAQDEKTEVKEGNPAQQRPAHGSDAGPNTDTRDEQLPSLNDGNKVIDLEKYILVRDALLEILADSEPTQTELMEHLNQKIGGTFDGNVSWYGETVKLDLEARELVERIGAKPERYRLIAAN
ncbi:MAG: hypothetical protein EON51_16655 [Acinetobacter sp.]|nr:MAG: hypothetical protein EON51_16655 [Acinetobacter sp.]